MTVAPELPALEHRPARGGRPARAARRRTAAAHPAGAVAPRPTTSDQPVASDGTAALDVPAAWPTGHPVRRPAPSGARRPDERHAVSRTATPPRRAGAPVVLLPGPRLPSRADLDPAAFAPVRRHPVIELDDHTPGVGTAGSHHPAVPGRLRVTGTRVVRPARPPMRLTGRGRLLVALLAGLAVVAGMFLVTSRVGALREPASPVPASAPAAVIVAPGESLWTIAERVAPERDPRVVVDQLRRINRLPSTDVQAGQRILLRAP